MSAPKKGRKEGENAAENAKAFERRCRPPITENRRRQLAEVFVSRNNHSRKQNRAFSGYARGWFLTIPCRALLASASAPPPYSRKSRFAAIFREYLVLYNNQMRTRICKNFCFRRKGEAARFCNMRALNYRAARKTPTVSGFAACRGVVLNLTEKSFISLKLFS